jgi:AcrR family transcriptional regulator
MREPALKRSRRDSAAARREQILEAACDMIFERGYEPVSMTDIGAAVGVSGPAIYRHFESKSDLLAVLCGQTIDRLIEFVGPRRATAVAELQALVQGQIRLIMAYPKLVRVFEDEERSLPSAIRREVRRREREHAARWVKALRELYPTVRVPDLEILVFSVVGMILSVPRWPKPLHAESGLEADLEASAWRILGAAANPARDLRNLDAPQPFAGSAPPEALLADY